MLCHIILEGDRVHVLSHHSGEKILSIDCLVLKKSYAKVSPMVCLLKCCSVRNRGTTSIPPYHICIISNDTLASRGERHRVARWISSSIFMFTRWDRLLCAHQLNENRFRKSCKADKALTTSYHPSEFVHSPKSPID